MEALQLPRPKKIDVAVPANLLCGMPVDAGPAQPSSERWAPIDITPTGVPEVSPEWTSATAHRRIDVREMAEFTGELGRVPGSELVPLATLEKAAATWDRHAPLVVICRSGGRSGRAALTLLSMGFEKVASMRGGMLAWNEKKLRAEHGLDGARA